jgi:serine/threonine protein phosphatase 1
MKYYACTDLHGRFDLYQIIKSTISKEDIVYFLGDAGDRGPDGLKLIKSLLEDQQFIYLKGNHEDMLVDAARDYLIDSSYPSENYKMLERNGGKKTFDDWLKSGRPTELLNQLDRLPPHAVYKNADGKVILLSHAGYTPWFDKANPDKITIPSSEELIWSRYHFDDEWDEDHFSHCVVVHGHTPTLSLAHRIGDRREEIPHGAYTYCNGHKIGIDNLSAYTDTACLLDLDTLEEIIIKA